MLFKCVDYNTDYYILTLNTDGSYTLVFDSFVNQISGIVVYFTTDTYVVSAGAIL